MTLVELAQKYGSDKVSGFAKFYDNEFEKLKETVQKIFEIGIYKGASLRMWRDYFPKARVYGFDIHTRHMFSEDRITTMCGNQILREHLKQVSDICGSDIDIIIDDGGHHSKQQMASLGYLFNLVKTGGLYIIEDLQTSFMPKYEGLVTDPDTTYNFLKKVIEEKVISNKFLEVSEKEYLEKTIKSCQFQTINDKILGVIRKI